MGIMNLATSLLKAVTCPIRMIGSTASYHSLQGPTFSGMMKPESGFFSQIRTKVRCYFPRPSETKRVRRHGWEKRMSSSTGKRIIMRRLLKGRHVLTH